MFGFRINLFQALNRKKRGEEEEEKKKMERADWDWNLQTADIHLASTL